LASLSNIGETLAERLVSAGFTCYDDLASLGSVEVTLKIREGVDPGACYNMLYGYRGCHSPRTLAYIPKEERNQLKKEFDHAAGH